MEQLSQLFGRELLALSFSFFIRNKLFEASFPNCAHTAWHLRASGYASLLLFNSGCIFSCVFVFYLQNLLAVFTNDCVPMCACTWLSRGCMDLSLIQPRGSWKTWSTPKCGESRLLIARVRLIVTNCRAQTNCLRLRWIRLMSSIKCIRVKKKNQSKYSGID